MKEKCRFLVKLLSPRARRLVAALVAWCSAVHPRNRGPTALASGMQLNGAATSTLCGSVKKEKVDAESC
jgi:hypothetical protein